MIFLIIGILLVTLITLTCVTTDNCRQFGKTPDSYVDNTNYKGKSFLDGDSFKNIEETVINNSFFSTLIEFISGDEIRTPKMKIPTIKLDNESFKELANDSLKITWIGHSSLLIEIDGFRILTDPVWSDGIGPSSLFKVKRFFAPPIKIDELPKIDAILISHDHYDHLDMDTVKEFAKKDILFITPLGVVSHLKFWGVNENIIIELDWWEKHSLKKDNNKLEITATPSRHFSGRVRMSNPTLWASFAIIGKNHKVFFSGDGGPSKAFKDIQSIFGSFDICFIESGAYNKRWPYIHMNPINAIKTHKTLKGKLLIPIHWATFNLALHDWFEPAEYLYNNYEKENIKLFIPKPGQIVDYNNIPDIEAWWRNDMPKDFKVDIYK